MKKVLGQKALAKTKVTISGGYVCKCSNSPFRAIMRIDLIRDTKGIA